MTKTKLQFSFKIFKNSTAVNTNDWNLIPTKNVFLSLNYLKAIENTVDEITEFLYVIYYDNNKKPIGKSIFQILTYNASTFNFDSIPCKHSTHILKKLLNKKITLLVAGNIFATGENGFIFDKSIDDELAFHQVNNCIDALRETGVSMFYTSIVLFFGFLIFMFSSFGGTIALGGLVSITLLFAMTSNLLLLPALLLSFESKIANKKTLKEPAISVLSDDE